MSATVRGLGAAADAVSAAQGVAVAYLFGSRADGTARADSGHDVAVLFADADPHSTHPRRSESGVGCTQRTERRFRCIRRYRCSSIRTFPRVFGLTCARSRNSATPAS